MEEGRGLGVLRSKVHLQSISDVKTPSPSLEVRGSKRKYKEVMEEERGPKVHDSQGPRVQRSQGPRYLKVTFKYKLDSKEGPSCFLFLMAPASQLMKEETNLDIHVMIILK